MNGCLGVIDKGEKRKGRENFREISFFLGMILLASFLVVVALFSFISAMMLFFIPEWRIVSLALLSDSILAAFLAGWMFYCLNWRIKAEKS